jgi:hypothetical protein
MVAYNLNTWSKRILPYGGISFVMFMDKMDRSSFKNYFVVALCC